MLFKLIILMWLLPITMMIIMILAVTKNTRDKDTPDKNKAIRKDTDYSKCYQAKYLLTKNEWYEHNKLRIYASQKGLIICPKVRLLDIIEPRKGEKDYLALRGKIQSKHVDFVLCDQSMHIKAVLELDDNSHDRKDRKERDAFVDHILSSVGYTVIHTRGITETTLDVLNKPKREPTEQT